MLLFIESEKKCVITLLNIRNLTYDMIFRIFLIERNKKLNNQGSYYSKKTKKHFCLFKYTHII